MLKGHHLAPTLESKGLTCFENESSNNPTHHINIHQDLQKSMLYSNSGEGAFAINKETCLIKKSLFEHKRIKTISLKCKTSHGSPRMIPLSTLLKKQISQLISIQCILYTYYTHLGKGSRRKTLLFFVQMRGGGGPAQICCHLFIRAFLVNKRSIFPPKCL